MIARSILASTDAQRLDCNDLHGLKLIFGYVPVYRGAGIRSHAYYVQDTRLAGIAEIAWDVGKTRSAI